MQSTHSRGVLLQLTVATEGAIHSDHITFKDAVLRAIRGASHLHPFQQRCSGSLADMSVSFTWADDPQQFGASCAQDGFGFEYISNRLPLLARTSCGAAMHPRPSLATFPGDTRGIRLYN